MHVSDCPISKAGVNPYYGWEVPGWEELGLDRERRYMMLRPPAELAKAADSFNNIQLLDVHTPVNAADAQQRSVVGTTGTNTYFDEPTEILRTHLTVWTQDAIDEVEDESRHELSSSYSYDPDMTPGEYKGLPYDGRMVNIVANHVALVEKGRAGPDVRVADAMPKGLTMKKTAFALFVKNANKRFANDADIGAEELVELITAVAEAAADPDADEGADDSDANVDPATMDAAGIPEAAMEFLKGKLSDEELKELAGHCAEPDADADDANPDADKDAKDKKAKDAKAAKDRKGGASDAAPRRPTVAMDAATIRRDVIAELSAWGRACEAVAPFIGKVKVAMDAAPDGAAGLYRKALDSQGVSHKGVKETAALEAMVTMLPHQSRSHAYAADSATPSPLDAVLKDARPIHRS